MRDLNHEPTSGSVGDNGHFGDWLDADVLEWVAGYLGIVLREPANNISVRAVNGRCLKCGYHLAWIVIRGRRGGSAAKMAVGKLVDIAPE
jgi:hypothetical protein